jgi:RimJ/RimL family protein N-acetyltransferase
MTTQTTQARRSYRPAALSVAPVAHGEESAWLSLYADPGARMEEIALLAHDTRMRILARDGGEAVGGAFVSATDEGASLDEILCKPGREAQVVQAIVSWVVRSVRGTVTATSFAGGGGDTDPLLFPLCAQGLRLISTTTHVGRSLRGVTQSPTCIELVSRGQIGREVFAQVFEATVLGTDEKRFRGRKPASILAELEGQVGVAAADQGFFVARMAGQPVGVVLVRRDAQNPSLGAILWVGVAPAMRKRGLGTELVGLGLLCLAMSGMTECLATCDQGNRAVRRLFEKNECHTLGQERRYAMSR